MMLFRLVLGPILDSTTMYVLGVSFFSLRTIYTGTTTYVVL